MFLACALCAGSPHSAFPMWKLHRAMGTDLHLFLLSCSLHLECIKTLLEQTKLNLFSKADTSLSPAVRGPSPSCSQEALCVPQWWHLPSCFSPIWQWMGPRPGARTGSLSYTIFHCHAHTWGQLCRLKWKIECFFLQYFKTPSFLSLPERETLEGNFVFVALINTSVTLYPTAPLGSDLSWVPETSQMQLLQTPGSKEMVISEAAWRSLCKVQHQSNEDAETAPSGPTSEKPEGRAHSLCFDKQRETKTYLF